MQTWDIAKLLLANCHSAEDVDQVLQLLNNANSTRDICSRLQRFSSHQLPVFSESSNEENEPSDLLPPLRTFDLGLKGMSTTTGTPSEITQAYRFEALLRASGRTNKQIEQWITENFHIKRNVGKGSLRLYLARVLSAADLNSRNRMLAGAYDLISKDIDANSDILDFWDELDKRFITRNE